jgi:hypothetical protein
MTPRSLAGKSVLRGPLAPFGLLWEAGLSPLLGALAQPEGFVLNLRLKSPGCRGHATAGGGLKRILIL